MSEARNITFKAAGLMYWLYLWSDCAVGPPTLAAVHRLGLLARRLGLLARLGLLGITGRSCAGPACGKLKPVGLWPCTGEVPEVPDDVKSS